MCARSALQALILKSEVEAAQLTANYALLLRILKPEQQFALHVLPMASLCQEVLLVLTVCAVQATQGQMVVHAWNACQVPSRRTMVHLIAYRASKANSVIARQLQVIATIAWLVPIHHPKAIKLSIASATRVGSNRTEAPSKH